MRKILIIFMFVLVIIDQLTKWFASEHLPFHEAVNIVPFFSLYLTHNKGIAFSMLEWLGPGGLILLSAVIIVFMIYLWKQVPRHQQLSLLGFAFVIAGAIGNLIDRISQGHVVDFFLLHTQSWAFAVFNVADSFITIGAICIIVEELFAMRRKSTKPE
ncbi:MAG: signal peptidase II [Rhizobiaceae bacterium]